MANRAIACRELLSFNVMSCQTGVCAVGETRPAVVHPIPAGHAQFREVRKQPPLAASQPHCLSHSRAAIIGR